MVLSYLTSRGFACAAHQTCPVFSAAHLQPSRDPLHREGLRPAESRVLGAAPPHAGLSHDQQIMPSRPSVNSRPAPPSSPGSPPRNAHCKSGENAWQNRPQLPAFQYPLVCNAVQASISRICRIFTRRFGPQSVSKRCEHVPNRLQVYPSPRQSPSGSSARPPCPARPGEIPRRAP